MTLPSETASNQSELSDIISIYSEDETVNYSDDRALKNLSLNVGGWLKKCDSPDFENFISLYRGLSARLW